MGRSVEFTFQCQRAEVPQCLFQDILNLTKPRWRLLLSGPSQNNLGCKIENMKWFGVKKNFAMYCALYKTELQGSFTRHMNRLRDIFQAQTSVRYSYITATSRFVSDGLIHFHPSFTDGVVSLERPFEPDLQPMRDSFHCTGPKEKFDSKYDSNAIS